MLLNLFAAAVFAAGLSILIYTSRVRQKNNAAIEALRHRTALRLQREQMRLESKRVRPYSRSA